MAFRLVVLDLDGTLVDSSRDLAASVNAALARIAPDVPPLPVEVIRSFVGDGARALIERSLARAGSRVPADEVLPVFRGCYRERLLDTTRPYPGVAAALDRLRGRTLAVLTNKPGDLSRDLLAGLGMSGRFARIYGGGDVARKPDPEGLLRLLSETGASAAETVMVGDSGVDVRTGRAAGVATVGVRYGFDPASLSDPPPDRLIDDLRELPGLLETALRAGLC